MTPDLWWKTKEELRANEEAEAARRAEEEMPKQANLLEGEGEASRPHICNLPSDDSIDLTTPPAPENMAVSTYERACFVKNVISLPAISAALASDEISLPQLGMGALSMEMMSLGMKVPPLPPLTLPPHPLPPSQHLKGLSVIDLSANGIRDVGAAALAEALLSIGAALSDLNVADNGLGAAGAAAICAALIAPNNGYRRVC
jgi:hypothetical protein